MKSHIPWRIRMYVWYIWYVWFTINKNPSFVSINLPYIRILWMMTSWSPISIWHLSTWLDYHLNNHESSIDETIIITWSPRDVFDRYWLKICHAACHVIVHQRGPFSSTAGAKAIVCARNPGMGTTSLRPKMFKRWWAKPNIRSRHVMANQHGGFDKWGFPKIIHFDRISHSKTSSYWGTPISGKPHTL